MKKLIALCALIFVASTSMSQAAVTATITGNSAKSLYDSLTGPRVEADGDMELAYRDGTQVSCVARWSSAEHDAEASYECKVKLSFDQNGKGKLLAH